ncbi:MAG: S8/S53 family peptidase [Candidatus Heimdallarchaeota archaeon]|nr:S8/S53 family peptidase [Candidatus Heimdallarchaeota archaeon]
MKKCRIMGKILSLSIIMLAGTAPVLSLNIIHEEILINGVPGYTVPNPSVKVGELQDTSYTYTGADCVVYDYGVEIDDYVTIVVIDTGLVEEDWKELEQNSITNVDIVGFLTEDDESNIKWITDPEDSYLDDQVFFIHGLTVISAIAAIARDVKVIFVDIQMSNLFKTDPYGFEFDDYKLWEWLDDNQASKDIDIITCSLSKSQDFATSQILQKWDDLLSKDVIMVASAGNKGNYMNQANSIEYKYPQYYSHWYCIGSIDHETRTTGTPLSTKNGRSSFSSWFTTNVSGNHIVNWLAPGNGIPKLNRPIQLDYYWRYAYGTSLSTPYLTAIIALIITGYHNGIGDSTDPSLQKVVDILLYASSRSTFDQKMGYGYVDAYLAYGKAYTEGTLAS